MNYKMAGRNNKLRYVDDTTLMSDSEGELKSLWKVKEQSEKTELKLTFERIRSWYPGPSLHGKQKGRKQKYRQIFFSQAPISLWMMNAAMKLKETCSLEEKL